MTTTRKRITTPQQIKSLEGANTALAEIGRLEMKLEVIDGKASERIGKIKEKAAEDGEAARNRIKELDSALALYAEYNKLELFRDKKTLALSYGYIGFRLSTKVITKKTTLELLKKLFPGKGIRIKEEIDKDELKSWEDSQLTQIDAAKVEQDTFFYEVNREEVNKDLLKAE